MVPYDSFTIRLREEVFSRNPSGVLDLLLEEYPTARREEMRAAMNRWGPYLRFHWFVGPVGPNLLSAWEVGNATLMPLLGPPLAHLNDHKMDIQVYFRLVIRLQ